MKKLLVIAMLLSVSLVFASKNDSLTPQNVYDYCVEIGIKHPEIVTAQSIEETGWYECINCSLDDNNIFGFRWKGKYKEFDSWKDACNYYKRWQDKWYKTDRDYYSFLRCLYKNSKGECVRYATSETYLRKVKSIVNNYHGGWLLSSVK